MKKISLLLLILLSIMLLTACVSADISYKLSDDHTVGLDYRIVFTDPSQDVSGYISQIGSFWAAQGMSIYADNDTSALTGEKTITCESKQQAADEFSKLFTSSDSAFRDVTFMYTPDFATDIYSLKASISFVDIIRQSEIQDIPADQIAVLEQHAHEGTYSLSIVLPGNVTATNADKQEGNVCTWNLDYGEETQISLETKQENTANLEKRDELLNRQALDNTLIIAGIGAIGLCLIVIIVSIVVRRIKRKRASEVRVKHFR